MCLKVEEGLIQAILERYTGENVLRRHQATLWRGESVPAVPRVCQVIRPSIANLFALAYWDLMHSLQPEFLQLWQRSRPANEEINLEPKALLVDCHGFIAGILVDEELIGLSRRTSRNKAESRRLWRRRDIRPILAYPVSARTIVAEPKIRFVVFASNRPGTIGIEDEEHQPTSVVERIPFEVPIVDAYPAMTWRQNAVIVIRIDLIPGLVRTS